MPSSDTSSLVVSPPSPRLSTAPRNPQSSGGAAESSASLLFLESLPTQQTSDNDIAVWRETTPLARLLSMNRREEEEQQQQESVEEPRRESAEASNGRQDQFQQQEGAPADPADAGRMREGDGEEM
ncbi:hypothetical protein PWT90_03862 [Aphanocladium album]|nr:hypothetical protein PWT90_03862 [Aphanocladium album]